MPRYQPKKLEDPIKWKTKQEGLSIYDLTDEFEYHPEVIRRYLNKLNKIRSEADRRILAKQKLQNKTCFRSRPQKIIYVEYILRRKTKNEYSN